MADPSKKIKAGPRTGWAPAWNHRLVCVNMDGILRQCGVTSEDVRVKMIGHSIEASGWAQRCWHYNCWGVKLGGWKGNYYYKSTVEEDAWGSEYDPGYLGSLWRALPSYSDAVTDYFQRINVGSKRYGVAAAALLNPSVSPGDWWAIMGKSGYFTAKKDPVKYMNSICANVRRQIANATDEEKEAALLIDVGGSSTVPEMDSSGSSSAWWVLGLVALAGGVAYLIYKGKIK